MLMRHVRKVDEENSIAPHVYHDEFDSEAEAVKFSMRDTSSTFSIHYPWPIVINDTEYPNVYEFLQRKQQEYTPILYTTHGDNVGALRREEHKAMLQALRRKFSEPALRERLLATEEKPIMAMSHFSKPYAYDRYWCARKESESSIVEDHPEILLHITGDQVYTYQNNLGRMLECIRNECKQDDMRAKKRKCSSATSDGDAGGGSGWGGRSTTSTVACAVCKERTAVVQTSDAVLTRWAFVCEPCKYVLTAIA